MFVKNNAVCVIKIAGKIFIPGANELSEAEAAVVTKHPTYKECLGTKVLEVVSRSKHTIVDMELAPALKLVKEMLNRAELEDILENDHREQIRSAVKTQLDKIRTEKK